MLLVIGYGMLENMDVWHEGAGWLSARGICFPVDKSVLVEFAVTGSEVVTVVVNVEVV